MSGEKLQDLRGFLDEAHEACQLCHTAFSWPRKRKHFCKRCKRVVCKECSPSKALVEEEDPVRAHRICKECQKKPDHEVDAWQRCEKSTAVLAAEGLKYVAIFPPKLREFLDLPKTEEWTKAGHGLVRIKVLEAQGLLARNWHLTTASASDPFLMIGVQDAEGRTQVVPRSCAPRWDSRFEFILHGPLDEIHLQVYDKNTVSSDTLIGKRRIKFHGTLPHGETLKGWAMLRPPDNLQAICAGAVHLEITYFSQSSKMFRAACCVPPLPPPVDKDNKVAPPKVDISTLHADLVVLVDMGLIAGLPGMMDNLDLLLWAKPRESVTAAACVAAGMIALFVCGGIHLLPLVVIHLHLLIAIGVTAGLVRNRIEHHNRAPSNDELKSIRQAQSKPLARDFLRRLIFKVGGSVSDDQKLNWLAKEVLGSSKSTAIPGQVRISDLDVEGIQKIVRKQAWVRFPGESHIYERADSDAQMQQEDDSDVDEGPGTAGLVNHTWGTKVFTRGALRHYVAGLSSEPIAMLGVLARIVHIIAEAQLWGHNLVWWIHPRGTCAIIAVVWIVAVAGYFIPVWMVLVLGAPIPLVIFSPYAVSVLGLALGLLRSVILQMGKRLATQYLRKECPPAAMVMTENTTLKPPSAPIGEEGDSKVADPEFVWALSVGLRTVETCWEWHREAHNLLRGIRWHLLPCLQSLLPGMLGTLKKEAIGELGSDSKAAGNESKSK
eukprot:gnl/MRDRNA2_/MRDRNA2_157959_c0_seq1.p1 gnl/MRDRNA2_/MRDRNA2_157959_c0~~gnl/MRDRNA2_/MRDRNA2_157959_c0_seq1.p1  ORF type:complete len:718 (+),score=112.41 gnl/MRDRNA2_/MRDRNA2_157959_c0_seq1:133-2286(+)